MKKVFLGLFIAGTMMSFTSVNAKSVKNVIDESQCCTYGDVTICNQVNNCGIARAVHDLIHR